MNERRNFGGLKSTHWRTGNQCSVMWSYGALLKADNPAVKEPSALLRTDSEHLNDQTASQSYYGRMDGVSDGMSQ